MRTIPPENHPLIALLIITALVVVLVQAGQQAVEVQQMVTAVAVILAMYIGRVTSHKG
ncbi:hypothetical protein Ssi02_37170 [Sinosporangium siamense]|uniref:Uncharacterized protein n=1 Tax=Sinosporangium siamense TaxID=1367973 RepID=A0A919RGJ4_9ACTN|nr:hypothetical protein Ssi02_37170 [Sinosporangium siamense]